MKAPAQLFFLLKPTSDGWAIDLALYPGNYEYKFLVDGNWILDPTADVCDNSNGIKNNVLAFKPNYVFELKDIENAKKNYSFGHIQPLE